MTTRKTYSTLVSSENLELKLRQLEQKIVRGEADSDAFENFIVYQLERHKNSPRRLVK